MKQIQALILAAGKGKRINAQNKPKVLFSLMGKPLITYSLKSLAEAGFGKPVVVVGYRGEMVQNLLGKKVIYCWQKKQLGTAHAVSEAKKALVDAKSVLIIYGDTPFWQSSTLNKLIKSHRQTKATLSLVSVVFENPSFFQYGRLVRDKDGNVMKSIEEKEASDEEKKIQECNPSCYLVETGWLWRALPKIKKSASGEYYLTDILNLAVREKKKVNVLPISNWREAVGVNTREQLQLANKLLQKTHYS
ncbi:MAG TPA: sugar phosphate nucleotidyltransferase [Patescibacteria group bacterium]|nr:sugar phosphate nucleotidyltransferase [Patescibacteria group bacterium]